MSAIYFLGVDGGGTRCRARLETADGRVLGNGLSGPATLRLGFEAAQASVMAAARQSLREAGLPDAAFADTYAGIGLAGTGLPHAREQLEAWRHPFAAARFEGDGYLALVGAFGGDDGGVVIVGTGSIALLEQGGRTVRLGGYGFPISDEGSGADLGLNALRHALRALDGRARRDALAAAVMSIFQDDPGVAGAWALRATATDYATLAPLVVEHAAAGDVAAIRLMQAAGGHITDLAESLIARGAPRVALCGGLADAVKLYMRPHTAARLSTPQCDAVAGGIILAKQLAGLSRR